jgi:hypothetical protein
MSYDWRCKCGEENPAYALFCFACTKQRWAQLNVGRAEARGLLGAIVPNWLLKASQ